MLSFTLMVMDSECPSSAMFFNSISEGVVKEEVDDEFDFGMETQTSLVTEAEAVFRCCFFSLRSASLSLLCS